MMQRFFLKNQPQCSTWNIKERQKQIPLLTVTDRPDAPFRITQHTLNGHLTGQGGERLRIVQLSDLHLHPAYPPQKLARLAALVNAQQPDLIVFTGDLLRHASPHPLPEGAIAALRGMRAKLGKLAVRGNHDLQGWPGQVRRILYEAGFTLLRNERAVLALPGGRRLIVAGLDDGAYHLADPRTVLALRRERGFRLVLAHEPMLARLVPPGAAGLVLAGHTHAGQFRLLGLQRLWMPYLTDRMFHGWRAVHGNPVYVSAGLGESGLGLRICCPAELPVFDCWVQ